MDWRPSETMPASHRMVTRLEAYVGRHVAPVIREHVEVRLLALWRYRRAAWVAARYGR